jgi:hypothetical protein
VDEVRKPSNADEYVFEIYEDFVYSKWIDTNISLHLLLLTRNEFYVKGKVIPVHTVEALWVARG